MNKIIFTVFILVFSFTIIIAQVDMEINSGLIVETSENLTIEVSGDLIENNGYLKGNISSGDRGSISTFAGLTLTGGSVDQITRRTGTALSSSSPKTSLRSYELVNTGSSFPADVSSEFVPSSANNDESNGINDLFIYTKNLTTWLGYSDNGSTSSLITGNNVTINGGTSNIAISEGVGVGAKVYIEGPYQNGTNQMSDVLGTLPSNSPYTEAERNVVPPSEAVDWVLVELRNGTNGAAYGYRSAFIDINGNLIDDEANIGIGFPTVPGNARVVIKHRNHLSVMSNTDLNNISWKSQP